MGRTPLTAVTPSRENDYEVGSSAELTAEFLNGIFGDIGQRLRERELLEASFASLEAQGIQASLDYIQATIAPQLATLQEDIANARDEIDEILATGTAPNADRLGGHLPAYFAVADSVYEKSETYTQAEVDAVAAAVEALVKRGVGTIVDWSMDTLPNNLVELEGVLLSRTTFAELWAVVEAHAGALLVDDEDWVQGELLWSRGDGSTTFRTPDIRGIFTRPLDGGAGYDVGRALGSLQLSANKTHAHTASASNNGGHAHTGTTSAVGNHTHEGYTNTTGWHAHTYARNYVGNVDHTHGTGGGPAASHPDGGTATASGGTDGAGDHWHVVYTYGGGGHAHTFTTSASANHTHTITVNADGETEARPTNVAVRRCVVVS